MAEGCTAVVRVTVVDKRPRTPLHASEKADGSAFAHFRRKLPKVTGHPGCRTVQLSARQFRQQGWRKGRRDHHGADQQGTRRYDRSDTAALRGGSDGGGSGSMRFSWHGGHGSRSGEPSRSSGLPRSSRPIPSCCAATRHEDPSRRECSAPCHRPGPPRFPPPC